MGKHFGFSGSTIVAGGGKTLCGLILGLIVCTEDVGAATYYISPTGSDAAAGTSTSVPWKTWSKALGASTSCGDTLLVMDGTFTTATHGNAGLTRVCTAGNEFTIRAINQRVPLISNSGGVTGALASGLQITSSAYIIVDGLRIKCADNTAGDNNSQPMRVVSSNHMTLKNLLLYESNRYMNAQILNVSASTNVLVEDTEIYKFHRHGLGIGSSSSFVTARRLYCHSRNWADIPGGFPSGVTTRGDGCVAIYPGNDSTLENVLAENTFELVEINATANSSQGRRNHVLGSVAFGNATYPSSRGIMLDTRGDTAAGQVQDTVIRDVVVIGTVGQHAIASRSALNTQIFNTTVFDGDNRAFSVQDLGGTGGGVSSFFCTNCMSINSVTGFFLDTADVKHMDRHELEYVWEHNKQ